MRRLRWLVPGALILGGALALERLAAPGWLEEVARGYPWVAYALAFLLAAGFHRSRVALAAGILAGAELLFVPEAPELRTAFTASVTLLLLGGLSLSRDRGVRSPLAAVQAVAVAGVVLVAAFLWWEAPQDVARILDATPLPEPALGWSGLPQMQAVSYGMGLLAILWSTVRWRGPVERGFLWAAPAVLLAVEADGGAVTSLYLLAAAVVLSLSVLETSYAMAYRDDLTGLPARRALVRDLEALSGTYSLAMVDVDHFKKFNDRHGHDVGDQVLKMVASRLARAPGGGRAYRYGGEEFTLVYPGRDRDDALPHLEAVREKVADARFALRSWRRPRKKPSGKAGKAGRGRTLSVTVSLGVADSTRNGSTPDEVLKRADKALYRAKKAGRNRVAQ